MHTPLVRLDEDIKRVSAVIVGCSRQLAVLLERASDLDAVTDVLRAAYDCFIKPLNDQSALPSSHCPNTSGWQWELLRDAALSTSWTVAAALFCWRELEAFASTLLAVVACDWLPCLSPTQQQTLFQAFFDKAPAHVALLALQDHLSQVLLASPAQASSDSAYVTAIASDTAAQQLARLFAAPGSAGVQQLAHIMSLRLPEVLPAARLQQGPQAQSTRDQQQEQQQQQDSLPRAEAPEAAAIRWLLHSSPPDAEAVAAALVSAPERLPPGTALAGLPLEAFLQHAMAGLISALAGLCSGSKQQERAQQAQPSSSNAAEQQQHAGAPAAGDSSSGSSASQSGNGGIWAQLAAAAGVEVCWQQGAGFAALVLQRMCMRGYTGAAASALVQCARQAAADGSTAAPAASSNTSTGTSTGTQSALRQVLGYTMQQVAGSSPAAAEKLTLELLRHVSTMAGAVAPDPEAVAAGQQASGSGSSNEAQQAGEQQGDGAASNEAGPVQAVYPPELHFAGLADALGAWHVLMPGAVLQVQHIRFLITEKLLLRRTLPLPQLALLTQHLLPAAYPDALLPSTASLARAWSDVSGIQSLPLPQQGYLTTGLQLCLGQLPAACMQSAGGAELLGLLMTGVSSRLSSPMPAVRLQAMRVGRAFSLLLDPSKPLFADMGNLLLVPEELWPGATDFAMQGTAQGTAGSGAEGASAEGRSTAAAAAAGAGGAAGAPSAAHQQAGGLDLDPDAVVTSWGGAGGLGPGDASASDRSSDSDDDSLEAYDLEEDLAAEEWEQGDAPLQLRALAAALRKQDDVAGVLAALKKAEVLLRAAPDELRQAAPELLRALLFCRVPEWADAEAPKPEDRPEAQRLRIISALLAAAPAAAGDAALAEVYSPHLDQYQRLLLLDGLSSAAAELAAPHQAPKLELGNGAPRIVPGGSSRQQQGQLLAPSAAPAAAGDGAGGKGQLAAPGMRAASTRVWGKAALAKRGMAGPQAFRNNFADVALPWTLGLLRECHVRKHGVDLFGRDTAVLGRLLTTLGGFAEAAAQSLAAAPVAGALLELLRAPAVHAHAEPYVRRASLLAAAQVLASLPPARVAGAAIGRSADVEDRLLVERLQWLQGWAQATAGGDADEHCRLLAAGCVSLQADLGSRAMAAMEQLPVMPQGLLGLGGGGGGLGMEVQLPKLGELRLVA